MYNIKIRKELKFGGHTFRIVKDRGLDSDGIRAAIDFKRLVISINPDKKPSVRAQGLIHEIIHGVDEIYLNRQLGSDNIVEPLAEGIWQVLDQLGIAFDFVEVEDETRKE